MLYKFVPQPLGPMGDLTPIGLIAVAPACKPARIHHNHVHDPVRRWKFDSAFPIKDFLADALLSLERFPFCALARIIRVCPY